jgi:hypothetical protein
MENDLLVVDEASNRMPIDHKPAPKRAEHVSMSDLCTDETDTA